MTRLFLFAALAAAPLLALPAADELSPDQQQEIIRKFAAKEAAFAHARENYTYRQRYMIETLGANGRPDGKHEEVSDVVFTQDGKRTERTVYAPMDTLERIQMDAQDVQDMRSVQPFVLTTQEISEIRSAVSRPRPGGRDLLLLIRRQTEADARRRALLRRRDLGGRPRPADREDLRARRRLRRRTRTTSYPKFETYREQIDGKYWFPTYTVANDVLAFRDNSVPIKMVITYKDYKQFKSESTITYGDVTDDPNKKPQTPPKP